MRMGRSSSAIGKTEVVVLTADNDFAAQARETFGASDQIVLRIVSSALSTLETELDLAGATVAVIDLDAGQRAEMQALDQLMARIGTAPPVIVVTQAFDENVARILLQMRAADFLIKPVSPVELVRTCARVARIEPRGIHRGADPYFPAGGGRGGRHYARGT